MNPLYQNRSDKSITSSALVALLLYLALMFIMEALPPRSSRDSYLAADIDKIHRIQKIQSPRIVLLGGSNTAFSIDSGQLQSELGMPVVNMGLHASLGLRYMLNEAKPYIKPGDVIVLIPEYAQMYDLVNGHNELFNLALVRPQSLLSMRLENLSSVTIGLISDIKKKIEFWQKWGVVKAQFSPPYSRSAFNTLGDNVTVLNLPAEDNSKPAQEVHFSLPVDQVALDEMNNFSKYAIAHGARVFFDFPAIPESSFVPPHSKEVAAEIADNVRKHTQFRVIGKFEDNYFPDAEFYDSCYHLRHGSRSKHTEVLLKDLRSALREPQPATIESDS